jgi:hypothetical protein
MTLISLSCIVMERDCSCWKKIKRKKRVMNFNKIIVGTFVHILMLSLIWAAKEARMNPTNSH